MLNAIDFLNQDIFRLQIFVLYAPAIDSQQGKCNISSDSHDFQFREGAIVLNPFINQVLKRAFIGQLHHHAPLIFQWDYLYNLSDERVVYHACDFNLLNFLFIFFQFLKDLHCENFFVRFPCDFVHLRRFVDFIIFSEVNVVALLIVFMVIVLK